MACQTAFAPVSSVILVGILLALLAPAASLTADPWQSRLEGGSEVRVDPSTRRAIETMDGQQRPLWDGVHRLEDGSTLTVRDGIAVPTPSMMERWEGDSEPEPIYEYRYCKQLVRKTCGFDDGCDTAAACLRARTLLGDAAREQLELDPRRAADAQTATSARCQQALSDPSFPACGRAGERADNSRCRALVERVCGAEDSCASTQACDAAKQLQALETEERLVNADPSALSVTGKQCLEAMTNAFFEPCRSVP